MNISQDTNALFPCTGCTTKSVARPSVLSNEEKDTDEADKANESSSLFTRRELTPDEEKRVEFLKNMLVQTLVAAQGDPSDAQKARIREVEQELEKLTGIKTQSRLSNVTDKMPKSDEEEDESERDTMALGGIDPKEAIHNNFKIKEKSANPGMQMLRNNAFLGSLQALNLNDLNISTSPQV